MEEGMKTCFQVANYFMTRKPHDFTTGYQECIQDHKVIRQMYDVADFFENGPFELIENKNWIERLDRMVDQTLAMEAFNQYDLIRKQKCPKARKKITP